MTLTILTGKMRYTPLNARTLLMFLCSDLKFCSIYFHSRYINMVKEKTDWNTWLEALNIHVGLNAFHVQQTGQYDFSINLYFIFRMFFIQTTRFLFHLQDDKFSVANRTHIHRGKSALKERVQLIAKQTWPPVHFIKQPQSALLNNSLTKPNWFTLSKINHAYLQARAMKNKKNGL